MGKTNTILLLLVLIQGLLLLYEPAVHNGQQPLTELDTTQIDHIYIVRKPLGDVHLQKTQQQWRLVSDNARLANAQMIEKILGLLRSQSYQHFSSQDKDLSLFGLAHPQTTIRFNNTEIAFGAEEPLHSHRYILLDQQIHLINNYYYFLLRGDLSQFQHNES